MQGTIRSAKALSRVTLVIRSLKYVGKDTPTASEHTL
jgi:hypothetical protein